MSRPLSTLILLLALAGAASAQCYPWYPVYPVVPPGYGYPLTPAVWGAPAPKPLPPAPAAVLPKARPTETDEEVPVPAKSKEKAPGKESGGSSDGPRIPKTKLPLPGDPVDKATIPDAPKSDSPKKKDRADGKAYDQYVVPADARGEPKAEVKVGFFNHSDREIALVVNGEAVKLPAEQYVTLRLPRTFSWSEKGAKGNDVVVPPDADGIEIVFRR